MNNSLDSHILNIEEQQSSVGSIQEPVVMTKEQAKKQMEGMFKMRGEREPLNVDVPLYDSKDHHVMRMTNARKKKRREVQKLAKVGMGLSSRKTKDTPFTSAEVGHGVMVPDQNEVDNAIKKAKGGAANQEFSVEEAV